MKKRRTNQTAKRAPATAKAKPAKVPRVSKFQKPSAMLGFHKRFYDLMSGKFRTRHTDWKGKVIEALEVMGNVSAAAVCAGVGRSTVYDHMKTDAAFAAAVTAASEAAWDLKEIEIDRRAFAGVLKPVFFDGEQIDEVIETDTTLAIFRMKAGRPAVYRDKVAVSHELGGKPTDATTAISVLHAFLGAVQPVPPGGGPGPAGAAPGNAGADPGAQAGGDGRPGQR